MSLVLQCMRTCAWLTLSLSLSLHAGVQYSLKRELSARRQSRALLQEEVCAVPIRQRAHTRACLPNVCTTAGGWLLGGATQIPAAG
jgi:hypothetical protein